MKTIKNLSLLFLLTLFLLSCKQRAETGSVEIISNNDEQGQVETSVTDETMAQQSPSFERSLSLQGISFDIKTMGEGSIRQLTIQPTGLQMDNALVQQEIDGSVTNAEIEDLNSDGFPELLIYTSSTGSGSYGNVIGYSVNAGKSMSQIYFPEIIPDSEAGKGYMGHDEFTIAETTLLRRFPIYHEGDSNAEPTGNIRQIQYKLAEGEASRKFVIDQVIEIPKN
ncbi:MAG: PliI family lysozyme inhibitor of I-type lysozyme [Lutimonas sp.]